MSTETQVISPAVNVTDPAPPQTPTTTYYQQAVENFVKALDGGIAALPDVGLGASHPATDRFVRTHQNVPFAFMASAIAAVEQTPSLAGTEAFDPADARSTLQFLEAFTPLAERINAFNHTLDYTLMSKRADLAVRCLQIYAVSKGLARHVGASAGPVSLTTHVHTMKRNLAKRGGRRKASDSQQPEPQPQTPATSSPRDPAAQA